MQPAGIPFFGVSQLGKSFGKNKNKNKLKVGWGGVLGWGPLSRLYADSGGEVG